MTGRARPRCVATLATFVTAFSAACARGTSLPPEAYGLFEDRNDPIFARTLRIETDAVVLTTTPSLGGRTVGASLQCRSQTLNAIGTTLRLELACAGERIPYEITYRGATQDWVVVEDGSAPLRFGRVH